MTSALWMPLESNWKCARAHYQGILQHRNWIRCLKVFEKPNEREWADFIFWYIVFPRVLFIFCLTVVCLNGWDALFFKWFNKNKKDENKNKSNKPEIQVNQDKEAKEKHQEGYLFKTKQFHVFYGSYESAVTSDCKHFLGYLCTRPERSSVIPKECTNCKEVLECLMHPRAHLISTKTI